MSFSGPSISSCFQAAVADELEMVSGRFEEQLQHSMELKKEVSRSP